MDLMTQIQGILIALIGWAATAMTVLSASRLSWVEQRALIVFSWALWMMPALGALVYRGILTTSTAVIACAATTLFLAAMAMLGGRGQHQANDNKH